MIKIKQLLAALSITTALSVTGVAMADTPVAPQIPSNTPVLQYLNKIGASLAYVTTEGGLPGYMSDIKGHRTMIYLLPDGEHFLVGSILNSQGTNLTLKAANEEESKLTEALKQLKERASSNDLMSGGTTSQVQTPSIQANVENSTGNPLPVTTSDNINNGIKVAAPTVQPIQSEVLPPVSEPPIIIQQDVSTGYINPKISKAELQKDILKTAYFEEFKHSASDPVVYLIADPQCGYCHQTWEMLSTLMKNHKFAVNVILSDALPGSDKAVTQLLANNDIVSLWDKGVGSKDGVAIPNVVQVGSQQWNTADIYRLKNNKIAAKYSSLTRKDGSNSSGVPIIMYVGKDGKVRSEQGIYTGPDKLDAMKAFLSGLPDWNAADSVK